MRHDRRGDPPRPQRILIADDNAYYLTTIGDALASADFVVTSCSDGFAALATLKAIPERVDLAILNRDLPGLAGVDIVRRLRDVGVSTPILINDGYGYG